MLIKENGKNVALYVAITAVFSALLTGGKMALAVIPNVEVVTILIAVFAYVWGLAYALPAVVVFIVVQIFIYGFNIWVLQYFIHWPVVTFVFVLLGKAKMQKTWVKIVVSTVVAVVLTVIFGLMTSATDTFVSYMGGSFNFNFDNYWTRFAIVYARGISFYATQIICNAVLFATTFVPLTKALAVAKRGLGL